MAILNIALDDVGSGTGYVAYAGYVGFADDWFRFTTDWVAVLQQRQLACLHTADYLTQNPPAEGAAPPQRQWQLIEPFARVIHGSALFGACVGVEHAAYNTMSREDQQLCGRPDELAFDMFVSAVTGWTHGLDRENRIGDSQSVRLTCSTPSAPR